MDGTRQDHQRVSRIFLRAADLDPAARRAFLDEACKEQPELRREVESLLRHDRDPPRDLEPGALSEVRAAAPLVASIGPYRIVETLGEGGMGIVFRAVQDSPVRREVALKLIRAGVASEQVIARFETERQALALMSHPNVARVLDVGRTEQGQPYFAMEFIDGERITTYCDRRRLDLRNRLELLIQVCEGVEHAHRKAIIHRDLKASNVVVADLDGVPVPKIIDFGVAKVLDPGLDARHPTSSGALVGTPEYMSPEQARLSRDVDTRTDVYSLGVLLYELAIGLTPFRIEARDRTGGIDEMRRAIREDNPPAPSRRLESMGQAGEQVARNRGTTPRALIRELRGDLDWIAMRSLEKEPDRRYGSAAELAADIRRHLAGEAVVAGPPRATYRARKFIRRHRVGVGIGAGLGLLLLAVAGAMTGQATRLAAERERANHEAELAKQTTEFLARLFELSDPANARGATVTALELLDKGAGDIRREPFADAEVQARLLLAISGAYHKLGLYERADPLLEEAVALYTSRLGRAHPDTLYAAHELGKLYLEQGRYAEAERLFGETLEARKRVLGDRHARTLATKNALAIAHHRLGRFDLAEPLFREALEGWESDLGGDDPKVLSAKNNLALLYASVGRYDEAERMHQETLAARTRVLGADHPETLASLGNLGGLALDAGRFGEAEGYLRRALEAEQRVLGAEHPSTLGGMIRLADAYVGQRRYDEAESLFLRALEVQRRALREDHPETHNALASLASMYQSQGRLSEAEPLLRRALDGQRRLRGDEHPKTLGSMDLLAILYWDQGQQEKAEELFRETHEIRRRVLGEDHPEVLASVNNLAAVFERTGRLDEAEALFLENLETYRRLFGDRHPLSRVTLYNLGSLSARRGQPERALEYLRQAVESGFSDYDQIRQDPNFDSLRGRPEFEVIVAPLADAVGR